MSIYSEQEEWKEVEVFVVVKTYPNASRKYQEVVCTAAITKEGEWIRLYPIQFRQMEKERQFKKYTWVKTRIKRASKKDRRSDSYYPDMDHFEIIREVSTKNNWDERKLIVLPTRSNSLEEIKERLGTEGKSLGIFKPREITDFKIIRNEKSSRANPSKHVQGSLFVPEPPKELESIPYDFKYVFKCDDSRCKGHTMIILDWEINQAFRKWTRKYGSEETALEKIRYRWFEDICGPDKDTHLIVGSHNRFVDTFMVLGVFYPKKEAQLSLFDLEL